MIKVENLTKNFGPKIAVNDVSFNVERGEVLGFLGPNGAGKSTTMRMVTGFIPPTAGRITVGGNDMLANPIPAKRLIGYLPENAPSYTDMTVHGFLRFCAEMRGITGDTRKRAVNKAVERCMLENVLYQTIDTLSKGYRHRTALAQSIIHDPDILIMDEPTDGLDPNYGGGNLRDCLLESEFLLEIEGNIGGERPRYQTVCQDACQDRPLGFREHPAISFQRGPPVPRSTVGRCGG